MFPWSERHPLRKVFNKKQKVRNRREFSKSTRRQTDHAEKINQTFFQIQSIYLTIKIAVLLKRLPTYSLSFNALLDARQNLQRLTSTL